MMKWIKNKLGISALEANARRLESSMEAHRIFVRNKVAELREYTRVDADVGFRGDNTIILTGVHRGKGFVRFYDLGSGQFQQLVEHMKGLEGEALIRNIDSPPSFIGSFDL